MKEYKDKTYLKHIPAFNGNHADGTFFFMVYYFFMQFKCSLSLLFLKNLILIFERFLGSFLHPDNRPSLAMFPKD